MRSIVAACLCWCLWSLPAAAQDDVIARARAAADGGRRGEAIAMLRAHLETTPRDVDARLVYGLVLSWDGNYDEARIALSEVLAQAPGYLDARVALMNVEWWSGRAAEARVQMQAVLSREPGNTQARLVRQRLDARTRPWRAGALVTLDTFSDDRRSWTETSISLERETPVGPVIVRGSEADRFGLSDRQFEIEFYPVFRAGSYAFVGWSKGTDDLLYPDHRVSFDFFQSVGRGVELAGGYRQLAFPTTTHMYIGALTKYVGNWMLTAKATLAQDRRNPDAWSYHGLTRWYFGNTGKSYLGAGYTHGFTKEEPRGAGDLVRVNADTVRGNAEIDLAERLRLTLVVSSSRQERTTGDPLWQTTAGAGFLVRF